MTQWLKRYVRTVIVIIILIGSSIAMAQFKQAYELDRDSNYENAFKFAQLVFFLTVAYVVFTFLFNKWKEYRSLKNAHSKAQLELLKSKMDPHFFFNTLNNLYGLAIEKSDDTALIILKLSEVMRYTIYNGEKEFVTLREEIDYLKQYIEIHRIRHKHNLDIEFKEELPSTEIRIAPMILINLLENAFKHGIEALTKGAYIKIDIKAHGRKVLLSIENNRLPGISKESGRGLTYLKERLSLVYPKKHNLKIERTENTFSVRLELDTL
ncbi:hypothetical protein BFP97_06155 [Roseivirga sp. 4D4]|uniref:sensor histidine kinase n=1 Tax=Roseivirga sp. 4D4 TaxID=1889784 RepID=UPI0008533AD1|nr:sensor histidine kinase [Roseivirga sp. 4D4]OEK01115.1 hypothetical protein BFP97_06155 [Roseivirga sp. 4D4]